MSSAAKNRLASETSPYLLQHATNPVDWYPWGEEALTKAKEEDRPIFLSIGYSACHWCHVMERESFEDEEVAALLAADFVSIKVDREERPDLDEIYMKAVQALAGQGGWPMTVFLTPELEPFFGGTYFPPGRSHGRPGFKEVLRHLARMWKEDRDKVLAQGKSLVGHIAQEERADLSADLEPDLLDRSLGAMLGNFDARWGGWGNAPKFPHAMDVRLSLRHWARTQDERALEMATVSLDRMADGGIYDHLAGGFARYSTDEKWLIPHFEKMLYDNALLVPAYLEGYLVTGEERYARVAHETCDWALNEMRTPEGGFASSLDADSEGVEGKCYVWDPEQLTEILGEERGAWAAAWFGVTPDGNFEDGKSALWRPDSAADVARRLGVEEDKLAAAMEEARPLLLGERAKRIQPGKDDKVLTSWNGLMISALAQAHQVLDEERFLTGAQGAASFLLDSMRQPDGRLFATYRAGRAHLNAYLDDYAFLIQGLLDLYESDFDERWLATALELDDILTDRFEDKTKGAYFTTGRGHEKLIARLKNPHDGALPAGNGVQAKNLLRLHALTGDEAHLVRAQHTLKSLGGLANRYPIAFGQMLQAVDWLLGEPCEVVVAGAPDAPSTQSMLKAVRGTFRPQRVVALAHGGADPELIPLVADKPVPEGTARAYVCRDFTCGLPIESAAKLSQALSGS